MAVSNISDCHVLYYSGNQSKSICIVNKCRDIYKIVSKYVKMYQSSGLLTRNSNLRKMKSLEYLCESCLVRLLIATLEDRKKKIKTWIVSIEEWIEQLDIEDIKVNYFKTWDNWRYMSLITRIKGLLSRFTFDI